MMNDENLEIFIIYHSSFIIRQWRELKPPPFAPSGA